MMVPSFAHLMALLSISTTSSSSGSSCSLTTQIVNVQTANRADAHLHV